MTTSIEQPPAGLPHETAARAADHLWMHFARQGLHPERPIPVVTRGEGALFDNGLYCRPDDRGDVVVEVAPPLVCGQAEFDQMEQILRLTLTEAQELV